jgi:hypothetical protein
LAYCIDYSLVSILFVDETGFEPVITVDICFSTK